MMIPTTTHSHTGQGSTAVRITLKASDVVEMGYLPIDVRKEIDTWICQLAQVVPPIQESLTRVASALGVSIQTARRKYYALRKTHDWRVLINRAKAPSRQVSMVTPEFLSWYNALAERNQRSSQSAYRTFTNMWTRGEAIPGVDPSIPRFSIPKGFTYANLQKLIAKDKIGTTAIRRGLKAAILHHGPQVLTTRQGLYVGSHYMFDDLWHDNFVIFKGQLVRVLELDALDVFSGCKFAWGAKPRIQRDSGTFDGLKKSHMDMLLAQVLFQTGHSPRGTVLDVENGTAAVSEATEKLLFDRTGGLITVSRSGIIGRDQAVKGMFSGKGGGNPRHKSCLESLRNLIHNELAALPGQTGKDKDRRPESLDGELAYNEDILKAMTVFSKDRPDVAGLLQLTLLEYHSQFLPVLQEVYDRINRRTWHNLEGWAACGHITMEYRLSPTSNEWIGEEHFRKLPDFTRQLVLSTLPAPGQNDLDPSFSLVRQRKLSPHEVFQSNRAGLVKIPAFVVAELLGQDCARERKCERGYFAFQDEELSPEPLRYESRIVTPEGHERELINDTYLTFVNPFDIGQLFVHDARGRHIGISKRATRTSRGDVEGLNHALGNRNKRLTDLLTPVRERHSELTREAAARDAHNARVIDSALMGAIPPVSTRGITQDDFTDMPDPEPSSSQRPDATTSSSQLDALDSLD